MSSSLVTPGVVLKTRFVTSEKKAYQAYVDYVDRDDAKKEQGAHEKLFTLYQDYLSNPDKTSALFTQHSDRLDEEEKKSVKKLFQQAQENHSLMWQDVITFHNPWLEEQGLYDSRSHTLDEKKVMDITRKAMNEMLKKEKLNESAVWSAAIHYNTENIHIHIATVELHPTRERGMRKQKSIDAMKSQVVNQILNRGDSQKKINDLVRKHMVGSKQKDSSFKWRNRELKPLFLQIYNHLPEDKRQWQYSYNTLKPLKPYIDELSRKYIEKYHAKDYQTFLKKLDKEVDVLKKAYGEGKVDRHRYKHYKQNKINDLYKRMGNAFLKEMKEYDRKEKELQKKLFSHPQQKTVKRTESMLHSIRKMEKAFKSEYESWKNQRHYERLQQKIERNHEREREY